VAQSWDPQFSEDGQRLVFGSSVENLVRPVQGPVRALQVYVFRFDRGNLDPTNLMQIRLTNAQLPTVVGGYSDSGHSLDAAGHFLTFAVAPPPPVQATAALGVFRMDLVSGAVRHVSAGLLLNRGAALQLAAADHGSAVAFQVVQGTPAASTLTNGLFVWTEASGLKAVLPENAPGTQPLLATPLEFSPDGRRLLFTSASTNLVAGLEDVRVRYAIHDLDSGRNSLAVDEKAQPRSAVLLRDGGGVLFESSLASLIDSDLNGASDLFLQPANGGPIALMTSRIETLIPRTAAGISSLGDQAFSMDGRYHVFTSTAGDLLPGDDNGAPDVFLQDRQEAFPRLVSVRADGLGSGDGPSGQPALSDDGRYAAFISGATNLVTEDANGRPDLFRRDLVSGITTLVPSGFPSSGAVAAAATFAMSRNGQRFVWLQRESGSTRIVFRDMTEASARSLANGPACAAPAISGDGSTAGFVRQGNAFVYSIAQDRLSPALSGGNAVVSILLTTDASRVLVFRLTGGPSVFEKSSDGLWVPIAYPGQSIEFRTSTDGVLSADDRWLAFAGVMAGTPRPSTNGNLGLQTFVMNLTTGQTTQVSRTAFGDVPDGDSDRPAFSPDGRHLIYRSAAGNLVADDDNQVSDLFLVDRTTGVTRLASRSPITGVPWESRSVRGRFGMGNGELWMQTFATSPLAGDFNGAPESVRWNLPPDTDGDGLNDRLEQEWFGGLGQKGSGDLDQDGMSNADELAAGTDPTRSDSVLAVRILEEPNGGWTIAWPSVAGRRYRVLTAESLVFGSFATWEPQGGVLTATGPLLETRVDQSDRETGRYFRLSVAD
jgi:Tol biopolymer transport system component